MLVVRKFNPFHPPPPPPHTWSSLIKSANTLNWNLQGSAPSLLSPHFLLPLSEALFPPRSRFFSLSATTLLVSSLIISFLHLVPSQSSSLYVSPCFLSFLLRIFLPPPPSTRPVAALDGGTLRNAAAAIWMKSNTTASMTPAGRQTFWVLFFFRV